MKVDRKVQQKAHINFSLPNNPLQIQSDLKLIPTALNARKTSNYEEMHNRKNSIFDRYKRFQDKFSVNNNS